MYSVNKVTAETESGNFLLPLLKVNFAFHYLLFELGRERRERLKESEMNLGENLEKGKTIGLLWNSNRNWPTNDLPPDLRCTWKENVDRKETNRERERERERHAACGS